MPVAVAIDSAWLPPTGIVPAARTDPSAKAASDSGPIVAFGVVKVSVTFTFAHAFARLAGIAAEVVVHPLSSSIQIEAVPVWPVSVLRYDDADPAV